MRKCLCGCSKYQNAHVWCLMNVMHSWFCDVYLYFLKNTFSSEVSVLSDTRPFRNLNTFQLDRVLRFVIFQAFALRDIKWQPEKAVK